MVFVGYSFRFYAIGSTEYLLLSSLRYEQVTASKGVTDTNWKKGRDQVHNSQATLGLRFHLVSYQAVRLCIYLNVLGFLTLSVDKVRNWRFGNIFAVASVFFVLYTPVVVFYLSCSCIYIYIFFFCVYFNHNTPFSW